MHLTLNNVEEHRVVPVKRSLANLSAVLSRYRILTSRRSLPLVLLETLQRTTSPAAALGKVLGPVADHALQVDAFAAFDVDASRQLLDKPRLATGTSRSTVDGERVTFGDLDAGWKLPNEARSATAARQREFALAARQSDAALVLIG